MKTNLMIVTVLCLSATSFASGDQSAQQLNFDEIRVACQNPAKFHNQAAPANIQIACHDVQNKWVPDADGTYSMPNSRLITAAIYSDKYNVAATTTPAPCSAQVVACGRFKEISELVETVRSVSCDELVAFNGTAADYCSSAVNSLKSVNKEAIAVTDTGRIKDLCLDTKDQHQDKDMQK